MVWLAVYRVKVKGTCYDHRRFKDIGTLSHKQKGHAFIQL